MFQNLWLFLDEIQYNIHDMITMTILLILAFAGFSFIYIIYFFKKSCNKYLNQQLVLNEIKHSLRLIETLYSERHEYQNNLQVLKMMASMGSSQELDNYVNKIINRILKSGNFTKINDPVLAASMMSFQVKAKEYDIAIKVNCNSSLDGISDISVDLGRVFNLFQELMMESMIKTKGSGNEVIINIEEEATEYSFDFKVGGECAVTSEKLSLHPDLMSSIEKTDEIKKIIKKINGCFYFVINDGHFLRLKFTINKTQSKRSFLSKKVSSF